MKVLIDDILYRPETEIEVETGKLLCSIYGIVWAEAYYDPYNEDTQRFALRIVDKIGRLNEILHFKE
jgi:hypothetical protein